MCATWVGLVVPSSCEVRNNLDCDIFRIRKRLVNDVVYVPAAEVSEALTSAVSLERAVVVVHGERSIYHRYQTGTRMGVPASLTSGMEDVLGDVEVRVALYFGFEIPTAQEIFTYQVQQAVWKVASRHRR